jgi:hypothetical protein
MLYRVPDLAVVRKLNAHTVDRFSIFERSLPCGLRELWEASSVERTRDRTAAMATIQ